MRATPRLYALWLTLALAVTTAGPAIAQDRDRRVAGELVDRLATHLVEVARLPGLSVSILIDGEIAFASGYGFADLETRIPVDTSTRFRAASVSKMITATALARLYQEGKVDLDAPVQQYVPSWPEDEAVTARLLAGHLAGVSHYRQDDRIDRTHHYASVTEALGTFVESPRAGPPGAQYAYSTHGYTLLSAVVEAAAGEPFLDYLASGVFVPLEMTYSGPDLRASPAPSMSTLYGRRGAEPLRMNSPEDPSYKWGGGGLVSRPIDLTRMAWGYMDGFIRPDVVAEMWTSQRTSAGKATGVGIGWRIGEDHEGRRVIHHAGAMGGARSVLVIWPDERAAVSIMTNVTWRSSIERTAHVIYAAFTAPTESRARQLDQLPTGVFRYGGTFRHEEASGTLRLGDGAGTISMPEPFRAAARAMAVDEMPIVRISGGEWALVGPWGLATLSMSGDERGLTGRVQLSNSMVWEIRASR